MKPWLIKKGVSVGAQPGGFGGGVLEVPTDAHPSHPSLGGRGCDVC